jgi:nucleotidyltransferase substrate binding protein (TIGR01987 family)
MEDIRWQQRLINYRKAFIQLEKAVKMPSHSDIEREGLIQRFEYTYELAWNLMKDFLEEKGNSGIQGSKDAIRLAFNNGLITNGETWMEMVKSRRLSAHTYNENTANEIAQLVIREYYPLFDQFLNQMENEVQNSAI